LERLRRRQNDAEAMAQDPSVATNAAVAAARQEVDLCRSAFAAITNRYLDKHPKYLEAKARCDDSLQRLTQAVTNAVRQLEIASQQAEADRQAIERQLQSRSADAQALRDEVKGSTNEFVARTSQLLMDFHDRVLQRLKEDSLTGTLQGQPLKVFSAATTPTQAVGPDATRVIATGLIAGLAVGLLVSLVFGLGDTSLKSVDEAEVLLRLPVLSVVPVLRNDETEMAAAEGFRSLRTSISVLAKGSEPRSLLFTSTSPDEGKTFCALNFAVGLAQQGAKTVLVECDLRRPMAAPSLTRVKMDHPGVSEFLKRAQQKAVAGRDVRREPQPADLSFSELRRKQREAAGEAGAAPADASMAVVPTAGGMGLDEVLQPTEIENLSFVAAGAPVSNPSEMLGQGGFDHLMSELLKRFERVVIDSAPMLGISDTLLLSKRVQAICFVVRANQTPRRAVVRAVEILKRAEAPLAGVILNGLTPKRSDPYGQNYYYYYRADQKGKK
jgi:Mrp family chromosome partitioning ATPase